MTEDRTESLIRDALAADAERAVPASAIKLGSRGRRGVAVVSAFTAVAAAVAVTLLVVPREHGAAPAAAPPQQAEQTVLLVGVDGFAHADSVLLAHVAGDGRTALLSVPRDTWLGDGRVGGRYADAWQKATSGGAAPEQATRAAAQELTKAVGEVTGVRADHYAVVEMSAFESLAEVVGGVEVCVAKATRDPRTGLDLAAGKHVLTGPTLLSYLRQRVGLPEGDLSRVARLRAVLSDLAGKLRDPARVVDVVRKTTVIDPDWDLLGLAEAGPRVTGSATIPVVDTDFRAPDGSAAIKVDPTAVTRFTKELFADAPAATTPPATPSPGTCLP